MSRQFGGYPTKWCAERDEDGWITQRQQGQWLHLPQLDRLARWAVIPVSERQQVLHPSPQHLQLVAEQQASLERQICVGGPKEERQRCHGHAAEPWKNSRQTATGYSHAVHRTYTRQRQVAASGHPGRPADHQPGENQPGENRRGQAHETRKKELSAGRRGLRVQIGEISGKEWLQNIPQHTWAAGESGGVLLSGASVQGCSSGDESIEPTAEPTGEPAGEVLLPHQRAVR